MTRIGYNSTQWIAEDGRHLLERYLGLDEICRRLSRIPLELQGQPSLYLRGDDWIAAQHGRIINFTATGRSRDYPYKSLARSGPMPVSAHQHAPWAVTGTGVPTLNPWRRRPAAHSYRC